MPTILRIDGLRVTIYLNDHRPAHVHVIGSGKEAVFDLGCLAGDPTIRENYGSALRQLNSIQKSLQEHKSALCRAWEELHGYA